MKYMISLFSFLFIFHNLNLTAQSIPDPPTLAVGARAPEFKLKGIDGKTYTLKSFAKARVLAIVFSSPHCPTAQAYEERVKAIQRDYHGKGVKVVMVNPNHAESVCLEEMGYTDLGDSFEELKQRAADMAYNFPYLDDGADELMSQKYGPKVTPHIFIFDINRVLRYVGRIDDGEKIGTAKQHDARNAIDALLNGKEVVVKETKVFGCSVKWKWKGDYRKKLDEEWSRMEISFENITVEGVKKLLSNNSENLRVINVWATWCGPCVAEFNDLVDIYRMFKGRSFEMYTISTDKPGQREKVKQFLKSRNAAVNGNFLFGDENKYELIEAVDPKWAGNLPYTLIVEPGGKVVHRIPGGFNAIDLRKKIVENRLIGRYF